MNAPSQPALTLADVMTMISQSEMPERRKRDLISAVKRVSNMLGSTPAALKADVPALRDALAKVRPMAHGVSRETFANLRSLFTAALKLVGVAGAIHGGAAKVDPAWSPLVGAIATDRRLSYGLSSFMNWSAERGITPSAIDDATVQSFLLWLKTRSLKAEPRRIVRETVNIWNEARARVPGWPQQALTRLSFRPASINLSWAALPPVLRQEAEAYLALRAEPDVFDTNPRSPTKALAHTTIRQQREHIRLAVSVLIRGGSSKEEIRGLADLVSLEAFTSVLRHYHKKAGGKPNAFTVGMANTLIDVARYAVHVSEDHLKGLKQRARKLPPVPFDLTEKNKALLREFESEDKRARLLFLSENLIRAVKADLQGGRFRFVDAQLAVAIAILLVAPLRPENLIELNWSRNFKEPEGSRGKLVLYIGKDATKSKRRDLTFEFPPELAEPIRWYRREILPRLGGDTGGDIFISEGGERKSQETLSQQLTRVLRERVGIHMTPHQFRHLAAFLYLEGHPEDFQSVTDLLGHGWSKTTRIYAGSSSRRASRVFGAHVIEQRERLKLRRRGGLRKSNPKKPRAGGSH